MDTHTHTPRHKLKKSLASPDRHLPCTYVDRLDDKHWTSSNDPLVQQSIDQLAIPLWKVVPTKPAAWAEHVSTNPPSVVHVSTNTFTLHIFRFCDPGRTDGEERRSGDRNTTLRIRGARGSDFLPRTHIETHLHAHTQKYTRKKARTYTPRHTHKNTHLHTSTHAQDVTREPSWTRDVRVRIDSMTVRTGTSTHRRVMICLCLQSIGELRIPLLKAVPPVSPAWANPVPVHPPPAVHL